MNFIYRVLVYADDVNLLVKMYSYILYRKTEKFQQSLVRRLIKKQVLTERSVCTCVVNRMEDRITA